MNLAAAGYPSGGDQHVEPPVVLDDLAHQLFLGVGVAHIDQVEA